MELNIPWVEKYRPSTFGDIVLEPLNREILNNVLEKRYFPNLLFYGPPGTGKTTTIVNLINSYQEKYNEKNQGLVIHLNASDERGIDIIRNQINQFVNTKSLFGKGTKFVVLDEVDYMTKNAQQALRSLLQTYTTKVRFCLICNYISRIDEALQNEFIRLRFNQLPGNEILKFLSIISDNENLNLSTDKLGAIHKLYGSDMRGMINFMQSNQNNLHNYKIIDSKIWELLLGKIQRKVRISRLLDIINKISMDYNIERKNIIKDFLNYIIRNRTEFISADFLNFIEFLLHQNDCNTKYFMNYSFHKLRILLS